MSTIKIGNNEFNELESVSTVTDNTLDDRFDKVLTESMKYTIEETERITEVMLNLYNKVQDKFDNYHKIYKCTIIRSERMFNKWELYVNREYIGSFIFRFNARRVAKKYVMRLKRRLEGSNGKINLEEFIL